MLSSTRDLEGKDQLVWRDQRRLPVMRQCKAYWSFLVGRALRLCLHNQEVARPKKSEQHSKMIGSCGMLALGQTACHELLLQ